MPHMLLRIFVVTMGALFGLPTVADTAKAEPSISAGAIGEKSHVAASVGSLPEALGLLDTWFAASPVAAADGDLAVLHLRAGDYAVQLHRRDEAIRFLRAG